MRTKMHSEGVRLGGRGHGTLKDIIITKLQKYYDQPIRRNIGEVQGVKTAIFATLFYSISTDKKPQHNKCPKGSESWCFYQRAISKGVQPPSHHGNVATPIKENYLEKIIPVYQRLASHNLLGRCLSGNTQNGNESLHSMIWCKCPKTIFVSRGRVGYAVGQAICDFYVGCKETLVKTQETTGMSPGAFFKKLAHLRLQRGINNSNKQHDVKLKNARQVIKMAK
ncbi:hypothetical protein ANN_12821 [Periplaneta americana]|uniref:Uncharacterized protein n=1 Tax=Periplaneta americana TaxID=6978 RepID=A0ABQ8TI82_PERAM|nr:hypothetical protein ANN_12821 [Periplaneta americana]